ncbi:MAG: DNA polymerase III subunit gamma/tau [Desulfobacteraceae bacterium]|nr:DNA polymerase III subunit gamma/tau [Desulfobacteraceae bacterium]MCF8096120.1 DNA polymerase III subunit gamma/tau [Desulfobacteraceae bacterium]
MAYLVFARKYRPQQFDEVIGQSHITRTLANAVTSGRLAHAILFSGPRGTGKTTVARILAKCVNCESGPTETPCDQCRSCREIAMSNAVDVFEIDGASNNRVENVRELRENARYMPAHSPYKIYIIDEVHMLSDAAFNALLKILEEPPAHVLFFFATTEPNKIPITILSRCQRHDFRRVQIDAIIDHMATICREEGIDIDRKALGLIAREADGSIRDALSLLDQIVTCAGGQITEEQITDILGIIDRKIIFDSAEALFGGDMETLLSICDRLYSQGRHLIRFYAELIEHFRNLLVMKMGGAQKALSGVPAHEKQVMAEQVGNISEPWLTQILNTLFEDEWRIRQSISARHAMEMTFFRLFQIRPALSIDQLIEKIDLLRQGAATGQHEGKPPEYTARPAGEEAASEKPVSETETGEAVVFDSKYEPAQPAGQPQAKEEQSSDLTQGTNIAALSTQETWDALKKRIAQKSPALGACLGESTLTEITNDNLKIGVRAAGTNVNLLNSKKNIAALEKICGEFLEKSVRISLDIKETENNHLNQKKEARSLKEEALNHPLVGAAVKTFNGKIVDIKILPTGGRTQ